jgi:hypothetical protein
MIIAVDGFLKIGTLFSVDGHRRWWVLENRRWEKWWFCRRWEEEEMREMGSWWEEEMSEMVVLQRKKTERAVGWENVRWGEREKKIIFLKKLKVKIIILMI